MRWRCSSRYLGCCGGEKPGRFQSFHGSGFGADVGAGAERERKKFIAEPKMPGAVAAGELGVAVGPPKWNALGSLL